MTASQSFAIVNMRDGLRKDVTSFLLENDSFPILENAYLFRGRIERRSCVTNIGVDGRLKGTVGTTNGAGVITLLDGTVTGGIPEGVATFVIDGDTLTDPGGASPVVLLTTGTTTGTLNRGTGVLTTNALNTDVVYITGLPVMGLRTREQENVINDELLIGFDNRYTYLFDFSSDDFILQNTFRGTTNTFVWTGQDYNLFWSVNYYDAFWSTNNVPGFHASVTASPVAEGDGIRWYDGSGVGQGWSNFNPGLNGTDTPPVAATEFLLGGLIVLPYKDRLLVLNTLEGPNLAGSVRYPQRVRWSQNGTPFYTNAPAAVGTETNAWSTRVNKRGGRIDAPTSEEIVSAEFIKDTLIVYFERSTWQLVYTNNELLPFVWQKINTELGCESTFSKVAFDRGVFAVGNYGIITTDSVNVVRIDQKIPDEVFQIQNKNNGPQRVFGVRDFNAQLVYWTYPTEPDDSNQAPSYDFSFPNQVLVYNYLDNSWASFDDSFTCFGYWQRFSDVTWATIKGTWQENQDAWNSQVLLAKYPSVVAGNQRGFVAVFSQLENKGQNTPSLPISNIDPVTRLITCPNHNLLNDDYVLLTEINGIISASDSGTPNNIIYKVIEAALNTFEVDQIDPLDTWSGTYLGEGLITHIPNFILMTKQFNPFLNSGDAVRVDKIDFLLDKTTNGEFTAEFYVSDNTSQPSDTTVIVTTPESIPTYSGVNPNFETDQAKIWHRTYSSSYGSFVQNLYTLSDSQIRDLNIASSGFSLHGMIYYLSPAGRLAYDI